MIALPLHDHLAEAEQIGSGVGRARVHDHGIHATIDAAPEVLGRDAVAEHARRGQDVEFARSDPPSWNAPGSHRPRDDGASPSIRVLTPIAARLSIQAS